MTISVFYSSHDQIAGLTLALSDERRDSVSARQTRAQKVGAWLEVLYLTHLFAASSVTALLILHGGPGMAPSMLKETDTLHCQKVSLTVRSENIRIFLFKGPLENLSELKSVQNKLLLEILCKKIQGSLHVSKYSKSDLNTIPEPSVYHTVQNYMTFFQVSFFPARESFSIFVVFTKICPLFLMLFLIR